MDIRESIENTVLLVSPPILSYDPCFRLILTYFLLHDWIEVPVISNAVLLWLKLPWPNLIPSFIMVIITEESFVFPSESDQVS